MTRLTLTPERALALLRLRGKFNFNYADIAVVGILARKILAGEFKPEPAVRFDGEQLEDGLHRCAAIVITDKAVEIATASPRHARARTPRKRFSPASVWISVGVAFALVLTFAVLASSSAIGPGHKYHHLRLEKRERIDQNLNKHDNSEHDLRLRV